jgi:hypothetical protein
MGRTSRSQTVLPSLTAEDLKDLGVGIVGHRRKLLDAIAALRIDATAKDPSRDAGSSPPSATPEDRAERRQVTVMFSDLVGSTALSARMDPEDLRDVISAYQKCVAEIVRRFGGFVAKYMGDGVLVYFGYPEAHEDDAERAVQAGLEMIAEPFTIVRANVPGEKRLATLHISMSDATGYSAIIEYKGRQVIHHDRKYQVMTNSPVFDEQLALNEYWKQIGGTVVLPGTNRAADRFARASFYINAIPKDQEPNRTLASVFSVIRNVSVPYGLNTPEEANISSTRWPTVVDHKRKLYFFESALTPNTFWVDLLTQVQMQTRPSDDLLFVIDVQNDFCPGCALAVTAGDAVVPVINRLSERFDHVVLTQDWHPRGHSSFATSHPGSAPFESVTMPYGQQTLWPDHCVQVEGTFYAPSRK